MSSRDWEKELAAIDRQLASLPDEKLVEQSAATPPPGRSGAGAGLPASSAGAAPVAPPAVAARPPRRWVLYLRLGVALALAVGIVFWPYGTRCNEPLFGYLAGVGAIVAGGAWTAVWSWRHRAALPHILSLLIMLWGLGLGAWQTLPRVGLAVPTIDRPAIWVCR